VILVGEMRDEETVHTALSAAETGHLVLSTLHTVDAPETVNRIIDFFPPHQQQQARAMIAGTLKGIVSQRLVRTTDGHGRVACCEIMVMTGRVHDMILDPKLTGQLPEVVAEGAYYGMQTFDQHLLKHLRAGRITFDEAMRAATSPHDFKLMVAAEGPLPDSAAVPSEPEAPITVSSSPSPEPDYTATVSEPEPPVEPAVSTAPVHRSYSPPPSTPSPSGPPPSAPPPGMFS
jgi:twitching motility protein PilT